MSIKNRTLLALACLFVVILVAAVLILRHGLEYQFQIRNQGLARIEVDRAEQLIEEAFAHLERDLETFESVLNTLKLSEFSDSERESVLLSLLHENEWAMKVFPDRNQPIVTAHLKKSALVFWEEKLRSFDAAKGRAVMRSDKDDEFYLVVARDLPGGNGRLLLGYAIEQEIPELEQKLLSELTIFSTDEFKKLCKKKGYDIPQGSSGVLSTGPRGEITNFIQLTGFKGEPTGYLQVHGAAASIWNPSLESMRRHSYIVLAVLVLGAVASILLLDQFVLSRLQRLSAQVGVIGQAGEVSERLEVLGSDEVESLKMAINAMLERLEAAHRGITETEDKYRAVVEKAVEGIFLLDFEELLILEGNTAFQQLLGRGPEELRTMSMYDVDAGSRESVDTLVDEVTTKGSMEFVPRLFKERQGDLIEVEVSLALVSHGGRRLVSATVRDVRKEREAEQALLQAKKMESIGQLAGGIAHDFNNLLTIIMGSSTLLQQENLSDDNAELVDSIHQAANSAADLTRKLLLYGRKGPMSLKGQSLSEIVYGLRKMIRSVVRENIRLSINLEEGLPRILCDARALEQSLINLAVNARDAMPEGGVFKISASSVSYSGNNLPIHPHSRPGDFVRISVTDTGIGMSEEVCSRIFEPFFTTKEVGAGSGLGLAMVYGIVQQHQGWIEVESELEEGSTFNVFLPVADKVDQEDEKLKPSAQGQGERILVVEDQELLRKMVCGLLERQGYQVTSSATGREALDFLRDHSSEVDLLLTDVVMPGGISGIDVAGHVQMKYPQIKVVFMSGYSEDLFGKSFEPNDAFKDSPWHFIAKPFSPDVLARLVRRVLDEDETPPV